jgi:hypothetical protein
MSGTPAPSTVTVVLHLEGLTRLDVTLLMGEEEGGQHCAANAEYAPLAAHDEARNAHLPLYPDQTASPTSGRRRVMAIPPTRRRRLLLAGGVGVAMLVGLLALNPPRRAAPTVALPTTTAAAATSPISAGPTGPTAIPMPANGQSDESSVAATPCNAATAQMAVAFCTNAEVPARRP